MLFVRFVYILVNLGHRKSIPVCTVIMDVQTAGLLLQTLETKSEFGDSKARSEVIRRTLFI